jgi:hypothetical protein
LTDFLEISILGISKRYSLSRDRKEEMINKPWLKYYDNGVPTTIEYPPIPTFVLLK